MKMAILFNLCVFVKAYKYTDNMATSRNGIFTQYESTRINCKFTITRYPFPTIKNISWYTDRRHLHSATTLNTSHVSGRYHFITHTGVKFFYATVGIKLLDCSDSGTSYTIVIQSKNKTVKRGICKHHLTISKQKVHPPSVRLHPSYCGNVPDYACYRCDSRLYTNLNNLDGVRFSNSSVVIHVQANYVRAQWSGTTWYRFEFVVYDKNRTARHINYPNESGYFINNTNIRKGQCETVETVHVWHTVNLADQTHLDSHKYILPVRFQLRFYSLVWPFAEYVNARICLIDARIPIHVPKYTPSPRTIWLKPIGANLTIIRPTTEPVTENKQLQLLCTVTGGTPRINLLWQLNKTIITDTSIFNITKTESFSYTENITREKNYEIVQVQVHRSTLTFIPLYSFHNSLVRCGAMNQANENDPVFSKDVLLRPLYKPRIIFDKNFVEFTLADNFSFTCIIDSNPAPTSAYWKTRKNLMSKDLTLSVTVGDESDAGEYECTARNTMGESTRYAYARYRPPTFNDANLTWYTRPPNNSTFFRGEPGKVTCEIATHKSIRSTSEMTMYFSNKLIARDNQTVWNPYFNDYSVHHTRNKNQTIFIRNTSLKHEGWYRCTVGHLPSKRGFYTTANRPEKPVLHVGVTRIIAGKLIEVTCSSTGGRPAPLINITLRRNKTILPNRVTLIEFKQPLVPFGTTSAKIQVIFKRNDSNTQLWCETSIETIQHFNSSTYNISTVYYKPIVIIKTNASHQGGELRITCMATGNPPPVIVAWYHNKRRHRKHVRDNKIINTNAHFNDNGEWTCTAENFVGTTNATVKVTILATTQHELLIIPVIAAVLLLILVCCLTIFAYRKGEVGKKKFKTVTVPYDDFYEKYGIYLDTDTDTSFHRPQSNVAKKDKSKMAKDRYRKKKQRDNNKLKMDKHRDTAKKKKDRDESISASYDDDTYTSDNKRQIPGSLQREKTPSYTQSKLVDKRNDRSYHISESSRDSQTASPSLRLSKQNSLQKSTSNQPTKQITDDKVRQHQFEDNSSIKAKSSNVITTKTIEIKKSQDGTTRSSVEVVKILRKKKGKRK